MSTFDRNKASREPLLTIKQVAQILVCSEANVYSLLENGELTYVIVGARKGYRIDRADLDRFIQQRKRQRDPVQPKAARPRLKHIKL